MAVNPIDPHIQVGPPPPNLARVRIELACDPKSFQPIRSEVGDGVVGGEARIAGRRTFVWAQDGSDRGGSLGAAGGETIRRVIELADRAEVPVLGIAHSGGARLQEGVASLTAYAGIFRAQATARVPQVTVVCGPCAGGAAYAPAVGDFTVFSAEHGRMFLTGPRVVERVTRELVTPDELGGAKVHARNGVAQLIARDDVEALELARRLLGYLPTTPDGPAPPASALPPVGGDPAETVPAEHRRVYDVRDVIERIADRRSFLEVSPRWARNIVCGLLRIEGRSVAVIANQPAHLGGCIDAAAAEKGAWWVALCDRLGLPLAVLVDTPGFLPGTAQERDGVIRHGAWFLRAFGAARVPRATVTLRQSYGGAHIVMNSRDLGADLTLAWRGASIGVMGPRQAVEIVERRAIAAGADPEVLARAYETEHLPAEIAARDGFIDDIIEPSETRARLAAALTGPALSATGWRAAADHALRRRWSQSVGRLRRTRPSLH
jgi:acetyl-CoA carboxylase carboxyltransferase component